MAVTLAEERDEAIEVETIFSASCRVSARPVTFRAVKLASCGAVIGVFLVVIYIICYAEGTFCLVIPA